MPVRIRDSSEARNTAIAATSPRSPTEDGHSFRAAANLNIHLHCLLLDGVYRVTESLAVFR